MRSIKILTLLMFCGIYINIYAQIIDFPCDKKFAFYDIMWVNNETNRIYDSINKINYEEVDFELRIWNHGNGQLGITNDLFLMKHYKRSNDWRVFNYVGFKHGNTHKNMEEFFKDAELTSFYSSEDICTFWDTLAQNEILTIIPPTQERLSKILGGGWVDISHDSGYYFELIQKDCKRAYGYSQGIASIGNFSNVSEFKILSKIVDLKNKFINKTWKRE